MEPQSENSVMNSQEDIQLKFHSFQYANSRQMSQNNVVLVGNVCTISIIQSYSRADLRRVGREPRDSVELAETLGTTLFDLTILGVVSSVALRSFPFFFSSTRANTT